jgi:hypothetical protein
MFTKCTIQEAKSPVKISSDSDAWRDLISGIKGLTFSKLPSETFLTVTRIQRDIVINVHSLKV